MESLEIEAFVSRRWQEVAASKGAYWAGRFQRDWRFTWDASQTLLEHARRVCPSFPSEDEREIDLLAHRALRERLDRAAHAFARR